MNGWMQYGSGWYEPGAYQIHGATTSDVARSLAKLNRFVGHSLRPVPVAAHSLFVADICRRKFPGDTKTELFGLLHDVAETVTGDIPWAMKEKLSTSTLAELKHYDKKAEGAIFRLFNIPENFFSAGMRELVKIADWIAVATEKRDHMPNCPRPWTMLPHPPDQRVAFWASSPTEVARSWHNQVQLLLRAHNIIIGDYE